MNKLKNWLSTAVAIALVGGISLAEGSRTRLLTSASASSIIAALAGQALSVSGVTTTGAYGSNGLFLNTGQYILLNAGGGAYIRALDNGTNALFGGGIMSFSGIAVGPANTYGNLTFSSATPGVAACTSPTVTHGTTTSFQMDVGTGCAVSAVTLTLTAATNGWSCQGRHITSGATRYLAQTGAVSTTSVTMTNFVRTTGVAGNFADGDDLSIECTAR